MVGMIQNAGVTPDALTADSAVISANLGSAVGTWADGLFATVPQKLVVTVDEFDFAALPRENVFYVGLQV